ncbi:hypothetical protein E2320_006593 [Naja naja]|nr:hypothetical protein E2320_006593 [Naja naja]
MPVMGRGGGVTLQPILPVKISLPRLSPLNREACWGGECVFELADSFVSYPGYLPPNKGVSLPASPAAIQGSCLSSAAFRATACLEGEGSEKERFVGGFYLAEKQAHASGQERGNRPSSVHQERRVTSLAADGVPWNDPLLLRLCSPPALSRPLACRIRCLKENCPCDKKLQALKKMILAQRRKCIPYLPEKNNQTVALFGVSAWREGQKLARNILGPPLNYPNLKTELKIKAKEPFQEQSFRKNGQVAQPETKKTKREGHATQLNHKWKDPGWTQKWTRRHQKAPDAEKKNEKHPSSAGLTLTRKAGSTKGSSDGLKTTPSPKIQNAPAKMTGMRETSRPGEGRQNGSSLRSETRKTERQPTTTLAEARKKPYSPEQLREFMDQKAAERNRRLQEERRTSKQAQEERNKKLQEVYRKQREAAGRRSHCAEQPREDLASITPTKNNLDLPRMDKTGQVAPMLGLCTSVVPDGQLRSPLKLKQVDISSSWASHGSPSPSQLWREKVIGMETPFPSDISASPSFRRKQDRVKAIHNLAKDLNERLGREMERLQATKASRDQGCPPGTPSKWSQMTTPPGVSLERFDAPEDAESVWGSRPSLNPPMCPQERAGLEKGLGVPMVKEGIIQHLLPTDGGGLEVKQVDLVERRQSRIEAKELKEGWSCFRDGIWGEGPSWAPSQHLHWKASLKKNQPEGSNHQKKPPENPAGQGGLLFTAQHQPTGFPLLSTNLPPGKASAGEDLSEPTDSNSQWSEIGQFYGGASSFGRLSLTLVEQSLREEELRARHQSALLRLREKALQEKAQAELAWLEHGERQKSDTCRTSAELPTRSGNFSSNSKRSSWKCRRQPRSYGYRFLRIITLKELACQRKKSLKPLSKPIRGEQNGGAALKLARKGIAKWKPGKGDPSKVLEATVQDLYDPSGWRDTAGILRNLILRAKIKSISTLLLFLDHSASRGEKEHDNGLTNNFQVDHPGSPLGKNPEGCASAGSSSILRGSCPYPEKSPSGLEFHKGYAVSSPSPSDLEDDGLQDTDISLPEEFIFQEPLPDHLGVSTHHEAPVVPRIKILSSSEKNKFQGQISGGDLESKDSKCALCSQENIWEGTPGTERLADSGSVILSNSGRLQGTPSPVTKKDHIHTTLRSSATSLNASEELCCAENCGNEMTSQSPVDPGMAFSSTNDPLQSPKAEGKKDPVPSFNVTGEDVEDENPSQETTVTLFPNSSDHLLVSEDKPGCANRSTDECVSHKPDETSLQHNRTSVSNKDLAEEHRKSSSTKNQNINEAGMPTVHLSSPQEGLLKNEGDAMLLSELEDDVVSPVDEMLTYGSSDLPSSTEKDVSSGSTDLPAPPESPSRKDDEANSSLLDFPSPPDPVVSSEVEELSSLCDLPEEGLNSAFNFQAIRLFSCAVEAVQRGDFQGAPRAPVSPTALQGVGLGS